MVVKKNAETHFFDYNFTKGTSWYEAQFPPRPQPDHLIGDKSPYYLFHPMVPERVHSLYPHVKLIVILRNPVDRAYSHYWHVVDRDEEDFSFRKAVLAEKGRLKGEVKKLKDPAYYSPEHHRHSYVARGIYVKQIKRWLSFFPREQMLILSSDDLRHNPQEVMDRVFAFLGLPSYTPKKFTDGHRRYRPMNPKMRKRLSEYYRPYNQQLEELLGMKFNWE